MHIENGECGPQEEKTMRQQTARFVLLGCNLYDREYTLPLLKCISTDQFDYVMRKIHKSVCASHSGAQIVASKMVKKLFWQCLVEKQSFWVGFISLPLRHFLRFWWLIRFSSRSDEIFTSRFFYPLHGNTLKGLVNKSSNRELDCNLDDFRVKNDEILTKWFFSLFIKNTTYE